MTTEHGTTCANRKMRPNDLLMRHELKFLLHVFAGYTVGLCKVGLRLKASESSQRCE